MRFGRIEKDKKNRNILKKFVFITSNYISKTYSNLLLETSNGLKKKKMSLKKIENFKF